MPDTDRLRQMTRRLQCSRRFAGHVATIGLMAALTTLVACGGGGGDSTPSPATAAGSQTGSSSSTSAGGSTSTSGSAGSAGSGSTSTGSTSGTGSADGSTGSNTGVVTPTVPAAAKNIAAWGDSLTAGYGGTPYLDQIQLLLPGRQVFNGGGNGEGANQITARQGSYPLLATLPQNTIPATGGIQVLNWNFVASQISTMVPMVGSLAGVTGTVVVGGPLGTFNRSTPGPAVTVPPNTQFYIDDQGRNDWINVLWLGYNSIYAPDDVVNDTAAIVASLRSSPKRFIVLSILNGDTQGAGGDGYNHIIALNQRLQQAFPNNFIDVRAILVGKFDPTLSGDVLDHTADIPPRSLRFDFLHLNTAGYAVVAQTVADFIVRQGW